MMQSVNNRGFPAGRPIGGARAAGAEFYITKEEVARRLMKTARTIERWQRLGYIPFVKVGQSVLYKWAAIEARLDEKFGVHPPSPKATADSPPSPRLRRTGG